MIQYLEKDYNIKMKIDQRKFNLYSTFHEHQFLPNPSFTALPAIRCHQATQT